MVEQHLSNKAVDMLINRKILYYKIGCQIKLNYHEKVTIPLIFKFLYEDAPSGCIVTQLREAYGNPIALNVYKLVPIFVNIYANANTPDKSPAKHIKLTEAGKYVYEQWKEKGVIDEAVKEYLKIRGKKVAEL